MATAVFLVILSMIKTPRVSVTPLSSRPLLIYNEQSGYKSPETGEPITSKVYPPFTPVNDHIPPPSPPADTLKSILGNGRPNGVITRIVALERAIGYVHWTCSDHMQYISGSFRGTFTLAFYCPERICFCGQRISW